ncbi:MAG TPA: prepilin peptidase [Candidatus Acidoferrum sp.]|nr:prepilin peptidase [Candidatus Acidoferrum sp.]
MEKLLTAALYLLVFTAGAAAGSFLLVVVRRRAKGLDWVRTPSHCEACGRRLRWWELIPFFSYAALGGRCSACKTPIGADHFLCEAWLGFAFVSTLDLFAGRPLMMITAMAAHAVMTGLTASALLKGRGVRLRALLYFAAVMLMAVAAELPGLA